MDTAPGQPWHKKLHWRIAIAMLLGIVAGLIGGETLADKVG